ncbi:uncharacterized protein BXZ73DRAFT_100743 [Epithele typhae]|uniref:uncharacterized protein n=1 Tax=Epithele typhae TaxID=378194 RepID=UPI00200800BC|nr:uncharacterized protein BXZ73DRAFT_100743 [Epithele typhae]KAH9934552.1 hypothetical protein BXZ73DRAFT_100743 [Epithele typhae]
MPSLSSLSDVALHAVWAHLLGDLHAHVAVAQTCRRLRDFCNRHDDLWRAACFTAGFGRPQRSPVAFADEEPPSWKALACAIVKHASDCEIGSCMRANACFAQQYKHLPYTGLRTLHPYQLVEFHPLYFYLHFSQSAHASQGGGHRRSISAHFPTLSPSPSPPPPVSIPDAVSILLTHMPTFPECRYAQYGPLCRHPNASCAFATFPPVDRLEFENADGDVFMIVENTEGCTILDVNRALVQLIPADQYHLEVAYEHYQELALTSGLSLTQYASAVVREKGFLGDHEYPFLKHIINSF